MKVIDTIEQEDGSLIVELDLTKEDEAMLLNLGFETLMRNGMSMMDFEKSTKKETKGSIKEDQTL